ncbi:20842_t:CDS:2, partial [Racocetra persica]
AAYIGYMLASSGAIFATAIAFASVGAVVSPSLTSLYTKYVPASKVGELLGALGLLDAILRIVGPTTFDLLYSALVLIDPRYVWPCFTGILIFGCLLTFGVNPKLKSGE